MSPFSVCLHLHPKKLMSTFFIHDILAGIFKHTNHHCLNLLTVFIDLLMDKIVRNQRNTTSGVFRLDFPTNLIDLSIITILNILQPNRRCACHFLETGRVKGRPSRGEIRRRTILIMINCWVIKSRNFRSITIFHGGGMWWAGCGTEDL